MVTTDVVFRAYSDESGIPTERFQSLAVISGKPDDLAELRTELGGKLKNGVDEVKWEEVRGHHPKTQSAIGYLELAVAFVLSHKIRVDVLTWDTHDQRHAILDRDDIANLERMYYKNMIHIAQRWRNPIWALIPDENSAIDWQDIIRYLNNTRLHKPRFLGLFQDSSSSPFIKFQEISPRCSTDEPLIQLADLFAGMAAFCRWNGEGYVKWERREQSKPQPTLFELVEEGDETSRATKVRFGLIRLFDSQCKKHKLGVSIHSNCCLWTPNKNNPINFWNYEPQHTLDKAPVKRA